MSLTEEGNILKRIMLRIGSLKGVRIFRNNVGKTWAGQSTRFTRGQNIWVNAGDVVVRNARFFEAGLCVGSSDLIGFKSVVITPEMVGKIVAIFTACEVKTKTGKATPEQISFVDMVNKHGGIGMIVKDEEEAFNFVNNSDR